jgi:hypothetical protein
MRRLRETIRLAVDLAPSMSSVWNASWPRWAAARRRQALPIPSSAAVRARDGYHLDVRVDEALSDWASHAENGTKRHPH